MVVKGNTTEERIYFGDYEIYRKTINQQLDFERHTHHVNDDTKKVALTEYKTIENGLSLQVPVVTVRFQYDNHLGSASLELDENAQLITYEEYHPFGTTSYRAGRSLTETSLKRYKYVGKERDEETGLYYYGMRYYADWLCRFVSVDPLQFKYPYYTPFQYAGNKPVTFIDLDGGEKAEPKKAKSQNNGSEDSKPEPFISDELLKKSMQKVTEVQTTRDNIPTIKTPVVPQKKSQPQNTPERVPTISAYNSTGLNEDYLKELDAHYKAQAKVDKAHEDLRQRDPMAYDLAQSPGVQFGMAVTVPGYAAVQGGLSLYSGLQSDNRLKIASGIFEMVGGAYVKSPLGIVKPSESGIMTFYRSMSNDAAEIFTQTGKMPAGAETFVSPTKTFAENFNGKLFEINVKPELIQQLEQIGVRNVASGHPYIDLPIVTSGWKNTNAYFKLEGNQVNIGLGEGEALTLFNNNIQSFKLIK